MSQLINIKVPDIGDYKDVPVIEVLVKAGDHVEKEQSIVVLESDKATMDVPSSHSGVVKEVKVKVGDSISEGAIVLILEESGTAAAAPPPAQASLAPVALAPSIPAPKIELPIVRAPVPPPVKSTPVDVDPSASHASPSVRKFAR
jgi:pyruvate dehydrogenase E2 component (dihydrolipoamide acetyltransferase)